MSFLTAVLTFNKETLDDRMSAKLRFVVDVFLGEI